MAIQKVELSSALNSLATQSSIDKVTGMLGGAAANISKADLATVVAGIIKYPNRQTVINKQTLTIGLKQGLFVVADASNDKAYIFSYDGTTCKSIMDNFTNPAYNKYSGNGNLYIENHTGSPVEFHVYSLV